MSSTSRRYHRSIHRLSLVIVFLLGICVVLLSGILNATSGYDTMIAAVGKLVGSITALGALLILYDNVFPIAE